MLEPGPLWWMLGMPQVLLPNDLNLAAEAYDKALRSLPPEAFELQPYTVCRLVAIHVIDAALSGVRDPARLREGALEYVRSTVAKGAAQ
jgi:hypothetical protein